MNTTAPPSLAQRYTEILSSLDGAYLAGSAAAGLSQPFLVSGAETAAFKVMVIGREYGGEGWKVKFTEGTAADYVEAALARHQRELQNALKQKRPRPGTFRNFLQAVNSKQPGSVIYSNLFAFDLRGKDPRRLAHDPASKAHLRTVLDVSKRLLEAQIEHFQPDLIVFANGIDSASTRREFFPLRGNEMVCDDMGDWQSTHGIGNAHLWAFRLYGRYDCLRIHHPSSFGRKAVRARHFVVEELLGPGRITGSRAVDAGSSPA